MTPETEYLVWSNEHAGWWSGDSGYTTQISRAGRFTRERALDICARALPGTAARLGVPPEIPVLVADLTCMLEAFDAQYPGRRREDWE